MADEICVTSQIRQSILTDYMIIIDPGDTGSVVQGITNRIAESAGLQKDSILASHLGVNLGLPFSEHKAMTCGK